VKKKRLIYELRWVEKGRSWRLYRGRQWAVEYSQRITKRDAERHARKYCHGTFVDEDRPVQLLIKGKDGRIQREASYGCDSKRRKG